MNCVENISLSMSITSCFNNGPAMGVELNTKPVGARNFPFGHLVNCCFNLVSLRSTCVLFCWSDNFVQMRSRKKFVLKDQFDRIHSTRRKISALVSPIHLVSLFVCLFASSIYSPDSWDNVRR